MLNFTKFVILKWSNRVNSNLNKKQIWVLLFEFLRSKSDINLCLELFNNFFFLKKLILVHNKFSYLSLLKKIPTWIDNYFPFKNNSQTAASLLVKVINKNELDWPWNFWSMLRHLWFLERSWLQQLTLGLPRKIFLAWTAWFKSIWFWWNTIFFNENSAYKFSLYIKLFKWLHRLPKILRWFNDLYKNKAMSLDHLETLKLNENIKARRVFGKKNLSLSQLSFYFSSKLQSKLLDFKTFSKINWFFEKVFFFPITKPEKKLKWTMSYFWSKQHFFLKQGLLRFKIVGFFFPEFEVVGNTSTKHLNFFKWPLTKTLGKRRFYLFKRRDYLNIIKLTLTLEKCFFVQPDNLVKKEDRKQKYLHRGLFHNLKQSCAARTFIGFGGLLQWNALHILFLTRAACGKNNIYVNHKDYYLLKIVIQDKTSLLPPMMWHLFTDITSKVVSLPAYNETSKNNLIEINNHISPFNNFLFTLIKSFLFLFFKIKIDNHVFLHTHAWLKLHKILYDSPRKLFFWKWNWHFLNTVFEYQLAPLKENRKIVNFGKSLFYKNKTAILQTNKLKFDFFFFSCNINMYLGNLPKIPEVVSYVKDADVFLKNFFFHWLSIWPYIFWLILWWRLFYSKRKRPFRRWFRSYFLSTNKITLLAYNHLLYTFWPEFHVWNSMLENWVMYAYKYRWGFRYQPTRWKFNFSIRGRLQFLMTSWKFFKLGKTSWRLSARSTGLSHNLGYLRDKLSLSSFYSFLSWFYLMHFLVQLGHTNVNYNTAYNDFIAMVYNGRFILTLVHAQLSLKWNLMLLIKMFYLGGSICLVGSFNILTEGLTALFHSCSNNPFTRHRWINGSFSNYLHVWSSVFKRISAAYSGWVFLSHKIAKWLIRSWFCLKGIIACPNVDISFFPSMNTSFWVFLECNAQFYPTITTVNTTTLVKPDSLDYLAVANDYSLLTISMYINLLLASFFKSKWTWLIEFSAYPQKLLGELFEHQMLPNWFLAKVSWIKKWFTLIWSLFRNSWYLFFIADWNELAWTFRLFFLSRRASLLERRKQLLWWYFFFVKPFKVIFGNP